MRVTWLFDPSPGSELRDLTGLQADALAARGHEVRIAAAEKPLSVFGGRRAEWLELDDWRVLDVSGDDVVVATSPLTARAASNLARDRALPKLDAGPIVADEMYRAHTPREREPLRVLIDGPSQDDQPGIDDSYGAVAHARWFHQKIELVRAAPWAPSREEPLDTVQEFHVALSAEELIRLVHSCDVVLAPGNAFAAAAAMAAGVPCLTAPERNAVELGEKLIEVLSDPELRERMRAAGREAAEAWRSEVVGEKLEGLLLNRRSASP